MERRLTAILAADVVGYSRLMGEDEGGTLAALTAHREELIAPAIAARKGRIVKLMGDGLLAEFASVVDAVECASEIQRAMSERNADMPEDDCIEFRIGINLGDVIVAGDDIYGDGVNVVNRLEGLAEPGGLCISDDVYRQVKNKVRIGFQDLGRQKLKNIREPVRVWCWPSGAAAPRVLLSDEAGLLRWPQLPSIAVLPFKSLSNDPEQEYVADAITEDLVRRLHQTRMFNVAAKNTTSKYKGQPVTAQDLGPALGVRYILEGSVRTAGQRAGISVNLLNVLTGRTLWAEKFDHETGDLFSLRDEVTRTIVGHLCSAYEPLVGAEVKFRLEGGVESVDASDYRLCGWFFFHRRTREANTEARRLFEKADELRPGNSDSYRSLAWCRSQEARFAWCEEPMRTLDIALELARKAVSLDQTNFENHWVLGHVCLLRREHEAAAMEMQKAFKLNPDDAHLMADMADLFIYLGKPQDAVGMIGKAMNLNPYEPNWYVGILAHAYADLEDIAAAVKTLKEISAASHDYHLELADLYVRLGRLADARAEAKKHLETDPEFSLKRYATLYLTKHPYKDHEKAEAQLERHLDNLRRAGAPE